MLPPYFQYDDATKHLEKLVSEHLEHDAKEGLGDYPQFLNAELEVYSIVEYQEPQCWKLSTVDRETGASEPVLFRMVGAIADLHLPPIPKPATQQAMERMRRHLKQSIALTGLRSESFYPTHAKIEEVYVKFHGSLPANSMVPWQPSYEGGLSVINMHNRFFTKRVLAPNRARETFHHNVDPYGVLEAMQNDMKFIHTSDNKVEFYGQDRCTEKTITTAPTAFREGDLVEVTVEFVAFPIFDKKHIFAVTLRAVKMLTCEYRTHAAILEMRSTYKPHLVPNVEKKRKALYADVDVDDAGDKLKRLCVSDSGSKDKETEKEHQSAERGVMNVDL